MKVWEGAELSICYCVSSAIVTYEEGNMYTGPIYISDM